jgi:flavin-binding protein dodecin
MRDKLELGRKTSMSVARVTELSATSETSFEDAINEAISRATQTLRGVESAWVKDMNVLIENGNIKGYKVNLAVTFLLEAGA